MNEPSQKDRHRPASPTLLIQPDVFRELVNERARQLLRVATGCIALHPEDFSLTRPLLGILQAESGQLEELLDTYGTRTNSRWYLFRARIAALKNFAQAGYELLHLQHAASGYNLLECCSLFLEDTRAASRYTAGLILCSLQECYREAQTLGLRFPAEGIVQADFSENLPAGRLPRDRKGSYRDTVKARVVSLATQFLHGTERARFLRIAAKSKPEDYPALIGDPISEESLRGLEVRFHNLQSLYDTYVSDSDTETLDPELPALRGHISAVLHLLRIGTIFIHFYERHILLNRDALFCRGDCPYGKDGFFRVLIPYCLAYSYGFLQDARRLCQEMLKRYAEVCTMEVPVPRYHGFHVRPSTLVALIARHYGSDVTLECGGVLYNVADTMQLFRANEWINRQKRDHALECIHALPLADIDRGAASRTEALREVLIRAAEMRIITIHEHPLPLEEVEGAEQRTFTDLIGDTVALLLHKRTINIESNLMVRLRGDRRVLEDIRALAENGYGENDAGNNVPLPPVLGYLRYSRNL
ncbi:MAG: hypothetical protein JXR77_03415 [Lentisphaeria bacterium]|nr:hypothetical protein [Lentisphaeria bacterium]